MIDSKHNNTQQDVSHSAFQPGTIVIGRIIDMDEQGRPLVDYDDNPENKPLIALSTQSLTKLHISRQVALLFNEGDPVKPVIMGLIHNPLEEMLENFELSLAPETQDEASTTNKSIDSLGALDDVSVDGQRVVIQAQQEIVLKCGEASITLTRAGKILIRGKYLLNRSSGVNRIMGGSVQVN